MWIRVLVAAVLAVLVAYAVRDLLRANPGILGAGGLFGKKDARGGRGAGPRGIARPTGHAGPPAKVLSLRRKPHTVLGVDEHASLDEARAAWSRQRDENDPGRLTGMSDDLRSLAEVRCKELDKAWQAFQDERA